MILSKIWRGVIAITFAYGGLAFAGSINSIDKPAGKASFDPRLRSSSDSGTEEGQLSSHHLTAITFAGRGFPAEGQEKHDPDGLRARQHQHLEIAVPEPSTFLFLGAALLYCSRRLRLHFSRG
jgi:hypothetical protein